MRALYATVTALAAFLGPARRTARLQNPVFPDTDAEDSSLSAKDTHIAKANRPARVPTDEKYTGLLSKPLRFLTRFYPSGKLRCGHQASGRGHLRLVLEKRETDRAKAASH